jgi:hypothetical protein
MHKKQHMRIQIRGIILQQLGSGIIPSVQKYKFTIYGRITANVGEELSVVSSAAKRVQKYRQHLAQQGVFKNNPVMFQRFYAICT